jgi:uridine phosphorylase
MKTALLKLDKEYEKILVVFGEDKDKVAKLLNAEHKSSNREFHLYEKDNILVIVAGLGSASVEAVMNEIAFTSKDSKVVLAGTCGASKDFELGEPYAISKGTMQNLGSWVYYGDKKTAAPTMKTDMKTAEIISTDAFYGFGCNKNGPASATKNPSPKGYRDFKKLLSKPFLIDMETAFFYAFLEEFNLTGISIKAASNYIPFESDIIGKEDIALEKSLKEAVRILA